MAIGAFIAGLTGAAATSALAVGIGSVLTAASMIYSAKTMFDGLEEGNIGKAILGGIGAFAGVSSLMSTAASTASTAGNAASAASKSSDALTTVGDLDAGGVQLGVYDEPLVSGPMVNSVSQETLGLTDRLTDSVAPVADRTSDSAVRALMDSAEGPVQELGMYDTLAKDVVEPSFYSKATGALGDMTKKLFNTDVSKSVEGGLSNLSDLKMENILNSKGLGYGLQYLGARQQADLIEKLKKQELEDYNRRMANAGDYTPMSEYARPR